MVFLCIYLLSFVYLYTETRDNDNVCLTVHSKSTIKDRGFTLSYKCVDTYNNI